MEILKCCRLSKGEERLTRSFAGVLSALVVSSFALTPAAWAVQWKELPGGFGEGEANSSFAIVTKKTGLASGLAHNHYIEARDYKITVVASEATLTPAEVTLSGKVEALAVDDPAVIEGAAARLAALGLKHAEFTKLSDGDRQSIRGNMLEEDQLAAEAHPEFTIVAKNFRAESGKVGGLESNYVADFSFSVRGKTVEKSVPLIVSGTAAVGEAITIEGLVEARFEDFGFEPYSAMLGAVGNDPVFHFYFRTKGEWQP